MENLTEHVDLLNSSILLMGLGKMYLKNNEIIDKIVKELINKHDNDLLF